MPKFIDLDDDAQDKMGDVLEAKAIELGLDKWESQSIEYSSLKDLIGICSNCQNMRYCKREFGDVCAICWTFRINLNCQDKIIECNEHSPRGVMSLRDMEMMATLIDIGEGVIGGFISSNSRLRKRKET